jgi:hypothetical protein
MADERFHELLVRAELEDCKILRKEGSTYLEFWGIVIATDAEPDASASRST